MNTTEELNGTYFYHGHSNLSAGELFDLIFLEQFCDELAIGVESGAAILSGQPWLRTRQKPRDAQVGTSIASKYARIILRDARLPFGLRVNTPVGFSMKKTNKLAAVIGRYIP
jgi:hypothetical protein